MRALQGQVQELAARLALNSANSGQPPSSDGLAKVAPKPRSLRTRSGRRPGGQMGHPGRTLQPVPRPDHVRMHQLNRCPCEACHRVSLCAEPVLGYEKRQVFELPQKPLEVTEHQAEIKCCPVSGRRVTAPFPAGVTAPAQYGPRFLAQMVYFNTQHFIPYQRLTQLCQDLYRQPLSEATVVAANQRTYAHLAPFEQTLNCSTASRTLTSTCWPSRSSRRSPLPTTSPEWGSVLHVAILPIRPCIPASGRYTRQHGPMKWFLPIYPSRLNRRHQFFGQVFSGRFKAPVVEGTGHGYWRPVSEYVPRNPVRAQLLRDDEPLSHYRWSR